MGKKIDKGSVEEKKVWLGEKCQREGDGEKIGSK